jgi:hypothetical protein
MGRHGPSGRSGGRGGRHAGGKRRAHGGPPAFTGRPKPSLPYKLAKTLGMTEQEYAEPRGDDDVAQRMRDGNADATADSGSDREVKDDGPGAKQKWKSLIFGFDSPCA